jgi:hypothetical protein
VRRFTCHVILISAVPPKWQRFSALMQTLKCLSVSSKISPFALIQTVKWFNVPLNHVQFVVMKYALSCLLQLTVAMSLYKNMSSCNASSHFTHTLSLHSRTHLFNMPRYLLPVWNERPFYHYQRRAKMIISLVSTTYGRRCWVS